MGIDTKQIIISGLRENDVRLIIDTFLHFAEVKGAILFGSRAKGNYSPGSDVDICIKGKNISPQICTHIRFLLNEELPIPFFFDIIHYEKIVNEKLKEHVDRVGIRLYP
jgi:predicted nucleotidyltransferase